METMAPKLETKTCPSCEKELVPWDGEAKQARRIADCLRRCEACGLGWSNAKRSPVLIWRDPRQNVPEAVRDGVIAAMRESLNELNRQSKEEKLGSASSEDAVTWTVFKFLADGGPSAGVWTRLLGREPAGPPVQPTIVLWGVPITDGGDRLRERLIEVCDDLGESGGSRSEPDVILDFGEAGLVIVEVKYESSNEKKAAEAREWALYVDGTEAFTDPHAARASQRYELARNWRIGWELAKGRPLSLVNLVKKADARAEADATEAFRQSLASGPDRRFEQMTFRELLTAAEPPWPEWFAEYVAERGLV